MLQFMWIILPHFSSREDQSFLLTSWRSSLNRIRGEVGTVRWSLFYSRYFYSFFYCTWSIFRSRGGKCNLLSAACIFLFFFGGHHAEIQITHMAGIQKVIREKITISQMNEYWFPCNNCEPSKMEWNKPLMLHHLFVLSAKVENTLMITQLKTQPYHQCLSSKCAQEVRHSLKGYSSCAVFLEGWGAATFCPCLMPPPLPNLFIPVAVAEVLSKPTLCPPLIGAQFGTCSPRLPCFFCFFFLVTIP